LYEVDNEVYANLSSINSSSIEEDIEEFLAKEFIKRVDPKEEIEHRYTDKELDNWV